MASLPSSVEDKGGGQEPISEGSSVPFSDHNIEDMEFDSSKRKRHDDEIQERVVKGKTKDDGVSADLILNQPELQPDDSQDISNNVVVIELVDKTKEEKLIVDKATILHLINSSAFNGKYSGLPRRLITKHQVVLNIINSDHVSELLLIDKLTNDEGDWPVKCRRGKTSQSGLKIGIL